MFKKSLAAGLAGSVLLVSAAFAQSPPATTSMPAAAPVTASDSSLAGNWRASKLVGLNVYNEANESLGSINDLLTDRNGNIKAVVIGVGGFLGVGERLIAVPFDRVKFISEPLATTTSTSSGPPTKSGSMATERPTGPAPAAAKPDHWYPDHAVLSGASKDQLKAMPEFKYTM